METLYEQQAWFAERTIWQQMAKQATDQLRHPYTADDYLRAHPALRLIDYPIPPNMVIRR